MNTRALLFNEESFVIELESSLIQTFFLNAGVLVVLESSLIELESSFIQLQCASK